MINRSKTSKQSDVSAYRLFKWSFFESLGSKLVLCPMQTVWELIWGPKDVQKVYVRWCQPLSCGEGIVSDVFLR